MTLLWLLGWTLAQPLVLLGTGWLQRRTGSLHARPRRILLVSALPWLLPATALLAMVALATAKRLGWVHDHCLSHAPGHPHFCFEHLPGMLLGHGHGHVVVATAMLSAFGLFALRRGDRARRQASERAALTALSRGRGPLRVLEDARPVAFAAGGRRPRIYLSRGLLGALSRREQRMVVAHEAAHVRQRDLATGWLMEILLLLHPPALADRLRQLWRDAIELRADAHVARRFGRTETAELLVRLARAMQPAPVATGFGGGHLGLRVHSLLGGPRTRRRGAGLEALIAGGLPALLVTVAMHHQGLETRLGMVVRP